jgi:glycine/D-amino acid oxidase-like deaminating enzyme
VSWNGDDGNRPRLPESVDVVIVGAGIIGVSAAYYLAKRNISVRVVEKGRIAAEQSSRNWGWVRQQGRDEQEIPLAREGLRLWGELQSGGEELGFRVSGILWVTDNQDELHGWEKWAAKAPDFGVHSRILGSSEVSERLPSHQKRWIGGMLTPTDGRAEPSLAAPAIAKYARDAGAVIVEHCAARGFETSNGSVSTVVTEHGTVKTSQLVIAGGAWSTLFCRHHGIDFPQSAVNATVFRTTRA